VTGLLAAAGLDAVGALVGLVGGLGAALVVVRVPAWRRTSLVDRLAPHLRDAPRASRLLTAPGDPAGSRGGWRLLLRLLRPVTAEGAALPAALERLSGGGAAVQRRLRQAGSSRTLEQYRAEQLVCGAAGLGVGALLAAALAAGRGAPAVPLAGLVLLAGLTGVLARDWALSAAVARRSEAIVAEFPTIAELLALSVAAGEGATGALERVAGSSSGELAGELRRTLDDARAGAPLVAALEGLAGRTAVPALGRFVDGLAVALERGTPLAEVLRAQAQDVRELSRRQLMEAGGKKEIQMMLPVVFLVLPVTVLFAVFPGFSALSGAF
jgi:tight adherence protein C